MQTPQFLAAYSRATSRRLQLATLLLCANPYACTADNAGDSGTGVVVTPIEPNAALPDEPPTVVQGPNDRPATSANNTTPVVTTPVAPAFTAPVRFSGRFDTGDANNVIWSWSASEVIGGFTGTSIGMKVTPLNQKTYGNIGNVNNFLDVFVDNTYRQTLEVLQGNNTYALASGLPAGSHVVRVQRRTEAQLGALGFRGFVYASDGGPSAATAPPARRLELVGDSGSVGYGADANVTSNNMCGFTPATENAGIAFGAVAAKLLAAEYHMVGNSGKGIWQNRDPINDAVDTLPVMWTWTVGDARLSNPDYVPASWPADAVVVVIGGNDFANTQADGSTVYAAPPTAAFTSTTVKFLQTLRKGYPASWLFLVNSPMLESNVQQSAEALAAASIAAFGDTKAAFLKLPYDDGSRGFGCDYHMNAATHAVIGKALATAIGARTGWALQN